MFCKQAAYVMYCVLFTGDCADPCNTDAPPRTPRNTLWVLTVSDTPSARAIVTNDICAVPLVFTLNELELKTVDWSDFYAILCELAPSQAECASGGHHKHRWQGPV
eukprot:8535026-Pyramimonas_sp.AAC.1